MIRLIGLGLFFFGFWFIGQNIIFTSQISFFTFRGIAAGGSIILLIGGIRHIYLVVAVAVMQG
jgi:hypothetical protein